MVKAIYGARSAVNPTAIDASRGDSPTSEPGQQATQDSVVVNLVSDDEEVPVKREAQDGKEVTSPMTNQNRTSKIKSEVQETPKALEKRC
jgi:ribosomal protein L21